MTARDDVLREVATLETLLVAIATVTQRDDDGRRLELVKLRRTLSEQIAVVGREAERLFADDPHREAYRARYGRMRSMTAAHQAAWPAVLLGERPDEFRASARPMREANRDFIQWIRGVLTPP